IISINADTIKVWDFETGKALKSLELHSICISRFAILPDEQSIILAQHSHPPEIWNLKTKDRIIVFNTSVFYYMGLVVTPDGKQVIAGSSDNSITVWNPKKGIRIAEVLHGSEVTALWQL
ncbi:MAG: WD40 repeat domain-containing protein, partial [Candidatus Helarchaeota archaeon]